MEYWVGLRDELELELAAAGGCTQDCLVHIVGVSYCYVLTSRVDIIDDFELFSHVISLVDQITPIPVRFIFPTVEDIVVKLLE